MTANKLKRIPVVCPICGKVHTHNPSEYRSCIKKGVGQCCSRACSIEKRKETWAAKRAGPVIDAELQNQYLKGRARV